MSMIDLEWPYQVALDSELCIEDQLRPLHGLSVKLGAAPRGRMVTKIKPHGCQYTYLLYCFRRREDAQTFMDRIGGRHFAPSNDRAKPKRRNVWTWTEWGDPVERYPEIIAWLLGIEERIRFTRERDEVEAFLEHWLPDELRQIRTIVVGRKVTC